MDNLGRPMNWKGQFIILLIFTVFFFVVFSSNELQYQKQIDAEALLELKMSVIIDPRLSLSNWVNRNNICNWTGITCDHNQLVVSVVLKYRNLAGTIPPHIGNLSFLTILNLSNNHFSGPIPHELGKLEKLQYIKLYENSMHGSIPIGLGDCTNLLELRLNNNFLSGNIPSELSSLHKLQKLHLSSNNLSGIIPQDLANCTALRGLDLADNLLSGAIPSKINGFRDLRVMRLRGNRFVGEIPKSLSNCSKLRYLSLSDNALEGPIPYEILTRLTRLQSLRLDSNKLNGSISEEIGKLWRLREIWFHNNSLTGSIPKALANCSSLELLYLFFNHLYGTIPEELGSLTRLRSLWLTHNRPIYFLMNCTELETLAIGNNKLEVTNNNLSGDIPPELKMLTRLQILNLGINQFKGNIFPFLLNCTQLQNLGLEVNNFVGSIPSDIGLKLANLQVFIAGGNQFSGGIPKSLGNCSQLSLLDLSLNRLTGPVPQELGMLNALERLHLWGNSLSSGHFIGNVPSALGRLKNLQWLDLSSNKFQGNIPPEFSMLVDLGYLWLQLNQISGDIPSYLGSLQQLRKLDFSHNKLTGRIPDTIGQCFRLEMIDLSYNNLTGIIPIELSSLRSLVFYLNFSYNSLTGRLPSLGGMQHIQAIDISANKLSGPIPGDIGSCSGLQYLNLSENKLEGIVPISIGQLKSLESIDLSFNELSGPVPRSIANLTMLQHLNFSYNNLNGSIPNQGVLRNLSAASFLGNPGLRIKIAPVMDSLLGRDFMPISSQELHRATQGFSAVNLLGEGSFGSVYKALLYDNTLAAVKVFDQDPQNSYKNFVRECRLLSKIRHRNLVKVLSSCSTADFRALVLEYMSKGSLEQQLHKDEKGCSLSLKMRVNIALDVAHGMAYLHHDCSPPVLHCDLKPSNVLMDETMTAHIADFGISRLLTSPVSESSSTSRLKGTVGYFAPEYGMGRQVSIKGDVYSFGILIFEMVTRKRPTDDMFSGDVTLPRRVRRAFPDAVEGVVDRELLVDELALSSSAELVSSEHGSCLRSLIGLGLQCTREYPGDRPTIREVEGMLEKIVYGRAYGNLKEHTPVQDLLSAVNAVGHQNDSSSTSFTDQS
ncbi:putative leucine-rich repeat receptor-like serine/threonine-protein kinase At2g24130 [Cryptomeria japonica]|uniref:putative leucine-rich repeat receptor-like serine/threonine-protein kinase At2g24130 n=1 Tax=Cryptomeria japonica TaxID=3369 RepID=UPI0027DAA567|nr:putative leucine-rich repeat receptor-like serine/threonine-protein kinase At2g24130 [Cryptomeria japonica]